MSGALAEMPELCATVGREGRFAVIRVRLAQSGKLSLMAERRVMERLRDPYPYALYVFSDAEEKLWHFVNAPHGGRVAANKQYRRIVVGPDGGRRSSSVTLATREASEATKMPS